MDQDKSYLKSYKNEIFLFFLSFFYIFFFTVTVPLFWEEQMYQGEYVRESFLHWSKEIFFSFGENNIFHAGRPFDAFLFKILFDITGYNYVAMRFAKALLFGVFIVLIFSFIRKYMKSTVAAYATSFFVMCSLSLYIHTLVFAEPYLLTEVLKLIIFFFFLRDYFSEKTSFLRQFMIAFLFLLSVRAYVPAYSTMGILFLFTVFHSWRKIKRYAFLFLFFFLVALPWPLQFTTDDGSGAFSPKLSSIQHFFLNEITHYIFTPTFSLHDLYYKPFFALLSFFGIWLIIFSLLLFLLQPLLIARFPKYFGRTEEDFEKSSEQDILLKNIDTKMLVLFCTIWFFAEFPLWIILPEHATRYGTSILLPFSLLITVMILYVFVHIKRESRKFFAIFALTLVFLALLTNLAYVFAFRAGWGSSFIGIEKVQDYIAEDKEGNTLVLYYGQSTASEYYPINKSDEYHEFIHTLTFMQIRSLPELSEENIPLLGENYTTVYVLKRVTSGDNGLPPLDLSTYSSLELAQVIEGTNSYDPFDILLKLLVQRGFIEYKPNYIYVYRMLDS